MTIFNKLKYWNYSRSPIVPGVPTKIPSPTPRPLVCSTEKDMVKVPLFIENGGVNGDILEYQEMNILGKSSNLLLSDFCENSTGL